MDGFLKHVYDIIYVHLAICNFHYKINITNLLYLPVNIIIAHISCLRKVNCKNLHPVYKFHTVISV